MQAPQWEWSQMALREGQRNLARGKQCPARSRSRNNLWWCAWTISWSHWTVQDWRLYCGYISRTRTWHQLSLPGGLRGSWLLQCWNCHPTTGSQSEIQGIDLLNSWLIGSNHHIERKSWITPNYLSLWFLWWVHTKVWKRQYLEIFHRFIWLLAHYGGGWEYGIK